MQISRDAVSSSPRVRNPVFAQAISAKGFFQAAALTATGALVDAILRIRIAPARAAKAIGVTLLRILAVIHAEITGMRGRVAAGVCECLTTGVWPKNIIYGTRLGTRFTAKNPGAPVTV